MIGWAWERKETRRGKRRADAVMSIRYHVVSLAAVIVALGIGMLVGASVVGDRGMMKQQELLIGRLDADFERLVGDRDQLLRETEMLHRFAQEAMPHLLGGRLAGRAVAVVALPGTGDATGAVVQACTAAGAQVALIEFTEDALAQADPGEAEVWAAAIASSDPSRLKSLHTRGVAKVKATGKAAFSGMAITAVPGMGTAGAQVARALARESDRRGIRTVLGWTCGVSESWNADWPAGADFDLDADGGDRAGGAVGGQALSSAQTPKWSAQVYGVGRMPGNIATVLTLAGAEGVFGLPPAALFLPELGTSARQAAGGR